MAKINEDYVSFETAKLLKEKEFDVPCYMAYVPTNKKHIMRNDAGHSNSMHPDDYYAAPTLQMAMKWLREVHNIVVEPFIREDTKYVWYIHRIETKFNKKYLVFCWGSKNIKYERYEQACEEAIKYCLEKLI